METTQCKVTVVGGGITGLSAAFYAESLFRSQGIPAEVTLAEESDRFGGKIATLVRDGCVIEKGPDSFLARKPATLELSRDLSIEDELTGMNPDAKKTYILHRGRFHSMPEGLIMGIPTRIGPFMKTGLLSPAGKLRASLDLFLPAAKGTADETMGAFLRRRLGREVQERIAEPLLSGIYAGDPGALSLQSTFPQFKTLEQKHGSLILGMLRSRRQEQGKSGAPKSTFLTYRRGLSTLVDHLTDTLRKSGVMLLSGKSLKSLQRRNEGYELKWSDGSSAFSHAVILALPAFAIGRLFPEDSAVRDFAGMPYASVANVVLAFHRDEVEVPRDGTGFLVPRKENRAITACTWTSVKWPHTTPKDKILLRCYVGRAGDERWKEMDDGEIVRMVRREIAELSGVRAEPLFYEVTRWEHAMPQYTVGHSERIRRVSEQMGQKYPGVFAAGSAFRGIGIPDCIRQGREAAEQVLEYLRKN